MAGQKCELFPAKQLAAVVVLRAPRGRGHEAQRAGVIERLSRWLTPALTSVLETKRSRTAPLIDWHNAGHAVWTPRDDAALAREGYQTNAIMHRCVRLVSESAAQVGVSVRIGGREVPEHPLNALLTGANSRQAAGAETCPACVARN